MAALGGEVEILDELTEGSEIAEFAAAADAMAAEISASDPPISREDVVALAGWASDR